MPSDPDVSAAPQGRSARAYLAGLIVALLVPVLLFAGFLLFRVADAQQEVYRQELQERARTVALNLDRELGSLRAVLQTLATSTRIQVGDWESFYQQITEVRGFLGLDIVLRDAGTRQQIVNTRVPYGTALPVTPTIFDEALLSTRASVISDVYQGRIAQRPLFAVATPVLRQGTRDIGYFLALSIETDYLVPILAQNLPPGLVVDVFDRKGEWLARSLDHGRLSGRPGPASFLGRIEGDVGRWQGESPEGRLVEAAYATVATSGWLVAVSAPQQEVRAPLVRTLQNLMILGVGALGLSLLLAYGVSRRFSRPLQLLRERAGALGRGEAVPAGPTGLREADVVSTALLRAAEDLAERARERSAAEATLRESEERQRQIVEGATDYAIVTTDLAGAITSWSTGAMRTLGWEPREVLGHHIRLFFTLEDQVAGRPEAEMQMAMAEGRAADERWHQRKDGSRFWASGELQPLRDDVGRVAGYLKILRDRTREREAQLALEEANATLEARVEARTAELADANYQLVAEMQRREETEGQLRQLQKMEAVGQLTGGIAHDFNNMLAVVTGALSMLQRRLARGEMGTAAELIEAAMDGAGRATTLTKRLLAFSRQQPLAPEPVDANKLVADMSELLRRTLGEPVRFETVLAGGLWRVHADASQLENALLNLAINARDAMPEGGRLTIETANIHLDEGYAARHLGIPVGQYVMVAVTDTGAGMTPDVMARAFDPFFTTKAVGKGTGLGLSQVYGFVRQSDGHVKIYSELGQGTTVKVYLPRWFGAVDGSDLSRREAQIGADLPLGSPQELVLVVEDDARVRELSVAALRELGYAAIEADCAAAALRQLDAHPEVVLLFTDIVMPDVNGRKLADEALRRRPDLKVLFTTGYTRNAIVHNGVLDPGTYLISKPFTLAELAGQVRKVLGSGDVVRPPGPAGHAVGDR